MIENKKLSKEQIAHRAYELYEQRGGQPGKNVEDWVRAEKELTAEVAVAPARTMTASAGRTQN